MPILLYLLIGFALWFGVELGIKDRKVRVAIQSVMVMLVGIVGFSLGSFFGGFSLNLEANNQVKNLTRGLLTIMSNEDLDDADLRDNLKQLDSNVAPTYESTAATRESIKKFLEKYGIEYEEEISIGPN